MNLIALGHCSMPLREAQFILHPVGTRTTRPLPRYRERAWMEKKVGGEYFEWCARRDSNSRPSGS